MMKHSVGIAMMKIAEAPDQMYCLGLGSCVGVAVYDPIAKIAGLIHVLLPSIKEFENAGQLRTKFADTGISDMVSEMLKKGAVKYRLKAKLAGGATMFETKDSAASDLMAIGKRNVQSCKDTLKNLGIELVAHDTGGTKGRTICFDIDTSLLTIKIINKGEKVI
ncbi:MAG: chemotaxis protein CheD [Papillibacter sp.]|jgi:chemotaxis protein CheD|nr:chemotaxis protein CheD [Papillibacter sp.]